MEVSSVDNALILFADIIDSSKHSAVLGTVDYARQMVRFRILFEKLGNVYFPKPEEAGEKVTRFTLVKGRGDEGIIFCINPKEKQPDLIYEAVKFAFELKARMSMQEVDGSSNFIPRPMKIGVGIHYGQVAALTNFETDNEGRRRKVITDIEGFSINYAKRIESCSRIGNYSNVFLSKKAVDLLEGDPIIFKKHTAPLKGIEQNEEVYEVQSAFFDVMPHKKTLDNAEMETDNERFLHAYCEHVEKLDTVSEPWLKGFAISVLNSRQEKALGASLKALYSNLLSNFAWQKPADNDPIVLFWRAKQCGEENKLTQRLSYLKRLVENYPTFVHARKKMVEACWDIASAAEERAEKVLARDIADEFIHKFPEYLSEQEKRKFEEILNSSGR